MQGMSFSPWNSTHLVSHLILPKQIFSRFSDTFMEKLSLMLHSYLNIASRFLVHSLICTLALRLPAEISSLVLQYSRTPWQSQDAFWRNSAAAINCKPYPDQTSTLQGCAEGWQKGGENLSPEKFHCTDTQERVYRSKRIWHLDSRGKLISCIL